VRAADTPVKVVSADCVDGVPAGAVEEKLLTHRLSTGTVVTLHLMTLSASHTHTHTSAIQLQVNTPMHTARQTAFSPLR